MELAGLKKQRASNKGRMTQIVNFVDQCDDQTPVEDLNTRLMRAEKLMSEFTVIESLIFKISPDEDSDYQYEESYYKAITGLNTWIRSNSASFSAFVGLDASINMTHPNGQAEVRLPKINIPIFSGEYTEWPSFYDLYCSTIHESTSLNPVQKFQYLKGQLRGEAEKLLRHISITEANYMEALTKLKERYNRKRPIIQSFIRTFIDQPGIQTATAANIKRLMDTSDEVIRGLKAMGKSAETRDPWLIYLLLSKLDEKSKSQWAETTTDVDNPAFVDFLKFLARRIDVLESFTSSTKRTNSKLPISGHIATNQPSFKCALCKEDHSLFLCPAFNSMNSIQRREWAKESHRCFNCLSLKHPVFKCTSQRRCQHCQRKHHSLLHSDEQYDAPTNDTNINSESKAKGHSGSPRTQARTESANTSRINIGINKTTCSAVCSSRSPSQTILPTAIIGIVDSNGRTQTFRALLDSGSQVSFITEASTQRLNLKRRNARLSVCGLGESKGGFTKGVVTIKVRIGGGTEFSLEAFVLPKITTKLPIQSIDEIHVDAIRGTQLADPNFHISNHIDVLIGADYFFGLLQEGQVKLNNQGLTLQRTVFGWVAAGRPNNSSRRQAVSLSVSSNENSPLDIDYALRRFWEIESISNNTQLLSPEEQLCEDNFREAFQKTEDGRFIVKLPFKRSPNSLGNSMNSAVQRLRSMERRFIRDPEFKDLYHKFMLEYHELQHMEEIPQSEINDSGFYLPHHGVLRTSSSTTKLRVVFDGSAKSSSGISLNDCLAVGPTIQSTLYSILLRFREHHTVFSADVEKMYRQVRISKDDTQYQKIVWRSSPTEPIRHYRLLTVTYGLASASFLATRTLKQIAQENQKALPLASKIIERDIYVDDLMSGSDTEQDAIQLQREITDLLKKHGFILRKWSSNTAAILQKIDKDDQTHDPKEINDHIEESNKAVKILGMNWNPSTDEFTFSSDIQCSQILTKRIVLSQASRLFDPIGWLAPVVVSVKIFIQQLWAANLDWDEPLPERRAKEWLRMVEQMEQVNQIRIPRSIFANKRSTVEMHGFCDASQYAYAAVVFFRIESITGEVSCKLISAKTKVAPIKQATLPRLELCGALLLTNLLNLIKGETQLTISEIHCWTDSRIVLDWLASHPRRWKTFVGNRTAEILNSWPRKHWKHVPTLDNPADCASRGLSPQELKSHKLWCSGPDWLVQTTDNWPIQQAGYGPIQEKSNQLYSFTNTVHNPWIDDQFERYSSFRKLQKVLAFMFRSLTNCRKPKGTRTGGTYLNREEVFQAVHRIYKYEQKKCYSNEAKSLHTSKSIVKTSSIKSLTPLHFLIGHAANKIPEVDITHLKPTHLARWQMVQQISQHFWKRWHVEYLTSLQVRQKWQETQKSMKINDIVVVKDENSSPNQWLLGKVIKTHPGSDGKVRVVTLKTKSGEMKRPIHKVCILPVANDDSTVGS